MDRLSCLLVTLAERLSRPRYDARLQFLEAQIRFLRARIDTSRILPSPNEKHELLRLGTLINHNVANIMNIVQPQRYNAWLRRTGRRVAFKRLGRPRIDGLLHRVILRMGRENIRWGYRRAVGENFYLWPTSPRTSLRPSSDGRQPVKLELQHLTNQD